MTPTSCKKEFRVPSDERARKQDEALFKGADMVRCIQELQTITVSETGRKSGDVKSALEGSFDVAISLAGEKAGGDTTKVKKVLKDYGYPPIMGE